MSKPWRVCALAFLVAVVVIVGEAKYEEAQISSVPIRDVSLTRPGSATVLYDRSNCGDVYGFTRDRFDYEVVRLNPKVDVYNLRAGQVVQVPWAAK